MSVTYPIIHIGEAEKVYIGKINESGDPVLTDDGLETWPDGTAVNNATITAQVRAESSDETGAAIGSPVTLTYVTGSNGHYTGTIPASVTATLTNGSHYDVWVKGSTNQVYRQLRYQAGYRQGK